MLLWPRRHGGGFLAAPGLYEGAAVGGIQRVEAGASAQDSTRTQAHVSLIFNQYFFILLAVFRRRT
jgi:hypothetical protein